MKRIARFCGKHRLWLGPLAGALIGYSGGVWGAFAGLVMGYLLQELAGQFRLDHAAADYMENPGRHPGFYEGEPGLAAWCALCVLVLPTDSARNAAGLFPRTFSSVQLVESFCLIAEQRRDYLNPDLLAESLLVRRRHFGDLPALAERLFSLVQGGAGSGSSREKRRENFLLETAARICGILDPGFRPPRREESVSPEDAASWELLGLRPGAPHEEIKSAYRKLAIQFHPDSLAALNGEQREEAAEVFIKIQKAYREVMEQAK